MEDGNREMVATILGRAIREDGREFRQGDRILLDQSCYTGRKEPEWAMVIGIAPGTAAVYPIKYAVGGDQHWRGQAKPSEIIEVERPQRAIDAEAYFEGMGGKPHFEQLTMDTFTHTAPLDMSLSKAMRSGGSRPPD